MCVSFSHVQLCDLLDYSLPGFFVHGIFQASILKRVAFPPPRYLHNPGIEPVSYIMGGFFTPLSHQRSPKVVVSFSGGSYGKESTTQVQSLGQEDPLEKEIATYSSILSCRIPWTEEPGSPLGFKESDTTE